MREKTVAKVVQDDGACATCRPFREAKLHLQISEIGLECQMYS